VAAEPVRYSKQDLRQWLEEDLLNDLQELHGFCMGVARKVGKTITQGGENLPQLNTAGVKAGRALRQIGVLHLEIAGLRQPVQAANGNAPQTRSQSNPGRQGSGDQRTRSD
jgi:hypothetical protein